MGPVSVSASRWHVYRLTSPDTTVSNEHLASLKKEIAFVKDTGVEEDREAACSIQKGYWETATASLRSEGLKKQLCILIVN